MFQLAQFICFLNYCSTILNESTVTAGANMVPDLMPIEIEDEESLHDFHDALNDYAPHIESLVALLRERPQEAAAIADLFRVFHNIKGDASLCRLGFLVPFVHAAENLLSRVRAGEVPFTPALGDVLLLTTDRLQQAIDALVTHDAGGSLHLEELTDALESLRTVDGAGLQSACQRLIVSITGVRAAPVPDDVALDADIAAQLVTHHPDLAFFHRLALQFESRSALFAGRTERNLRLALLTNRIAGSPVDADQLAAAVFLHDLGMMLLPEPLWIGSAVLSADERERMRCHVGWSAGLMERMPGWEGAATMVWQHHEKPDGSGYPNGLGGEAIVPGARILALVDAFEAVLVKQGARGQARSMLRAAAEVNAADHQFDPGWVGPFNRAVRLVMEECVQA